MGSRSFSLINYLAPLEIIADCRLPIADCRLPIADCRTPSSKKISANATLLVVPVNFSVQVKKNNKISNTSNDTIHVNMRPGETVKLVFEV
jgi:hypothetical protein